MLHNRMIASLAHPRAGTGAPCRPRPFKPLALALAVMAASLPGGPAVAGDAAMVGPALAAASNFSQGAVPGTLKYAAALGVTDFRDGLSWERAEPEPGRYDFGHRRVGYPVKLGALGARVSAVLNWGNPLYDGGDTPHGDEALRAFGAVAAAFVARFPQVDSLEIGNEFNGVNFVRGPIRDMAPLDRARAYVPLLEAAARAARAERGDLRIIGGATHSLPAAYIWAQLDAGAGDWMDSLGVHPYTTPAEQFIRQVAVLRRHPLAATLPLEVTEFGSPDPEDAAAHFLRNYCQFALGGVTRAVWYPLNERGDGMVPLFQRDGEVTGAGDAFRLAQRLMAGRPVADAAPDRFGYGCRFGEDVEVLWGAPRRVEVGGPGVRALDARGRPLAGPLVLSETAPLVLVAAEGGRLDGKVALGETGLVADSFHQFAYPEDDAFAAPGDGFERFARRGASEIPLRTLPGQQARGTPWTPYRGNAEIGAARLTARSLLPAGRPGRPVDIVHRYTVGTPGSLMLDAHFEPGPRSEDGISVQVTVDGLSVFAASGTDPISLTRTLPDLAAGSEVEIVVGPNGTARGDLTGYRIRLRYP